MVEPKFCGSCGGRLTKCHEEQFDTQTGKKIVSKDYTLLCRGYWWLLDDGCYTMYVENKNTGEWRQVYVR